MGADTSCVTAPAVASCAGPLLLYTVVGPARQIARRPGPRLSGLVVAGDGLLDLTHVPADGIEASEHGLLEGLAGRQAASGV